MNNKEIDGGFTGQAGTSQFGKHVWINLLSEAGAVASTEHILSPFLEALILDQENFQGALASLVGKTIDSYYGAIAPSTDSIVGLIEENERSVSELCALDLKVAFERNPAWRDYLTPFLYSKGFHAVLFHRVAHWLWGNDRKHLAEYIHGAACRLFGVDIHPAAVIGKGLFLDHATGFVVGETASIGDNVSVLHGVTLGGTGKESGDRHPIIESGVLLGAHAVVLGRIKIGANTKVAAGSVVLEDISPNTTVAGVPARVVRQQSGDLVPAIAMDQYL